MLKLGITGGIGSGKSSACNILSALDVPVFFADDVAKSFYKQEDIKSKLKVRFGDQLYKNGILDKKELANIVFVDPKALKWLNALIHPLVANAWNLFCEKNLHERFVVKETALLIESGSYKNLDYVLCVLASKETRINRVMQRDQVARHAVLIRMNNQLTESERLKHADFVIQNNEGDFITPQIVELYKRFKR